MFKSSTQPPRDMTYRSRLPRRCGFPMLQVLNGDWITDSETHQVELEQGKPLEYFLSLNHRGRESKCRRRRTHRNTSARSIKVNEKRFDGSRMTIKQMQRHEARITAIPLPQVLKRCQIDTETYEEVHDTLSSPHTSPTETVNTLSNNELPSDNDEDIDRKLLKNLFHPFTVSEVNLPELQQATPEANEIEPWNYPISTFDDLQSDERQYIRHKSKHVAGTLERDDHFFESTTFLDCVAQCERSRRLTIRAVDLLTQPLVSTMELSSRRMDKSTQPAPILPISGITATLTDNLTANFSKRQALESFERVADFQQKQVRVGDHRIEADIGDYLLGEHVALRHKTNQLLHGQFANEIRWRENAHGIEACLEESLSKVKLRNAVDLANTLEGSKEQKRLFQALIDSDARVIEEERIMEEHKSHRQRLRRINARQVVKPHTRYDVELAKKLAKLHEVQIHLQDEESPWQERNWKSKMKVFERTRQNGGLTDIPAHFVREKSTQQSQTQAKAKLTPSATVFESAKSSDCGPLTPSATVFESAKSSDCGPVKQVAAKFRSIETVEKAAHDPLVEVNAHDLLVRCSEIRQNKDKHVKALAMHRDRFRDDEAEWEHMRQDPINLVRRHLRRKLYQDVQQIQIGNMEYVYSPVFQ
ncbi:Hypothetical protein PHPALM_17058 [Phytophthora palmivora]|uniref:Uncharacterized protein n=1 Tax=Phytophthora palmivora TaxID=4796 RepID=A0A2P4XN71_9STRA|nr:Hypothetical protein PHPALM_17058 [Phytophthora palmivora]